MAEGGKFRATANFAKVIRCHESVDKALCEMSYAAYTVYKQQGA